MLIQPVKLYHDRDSTILQIQEYYLFNTILMGPTWAHVSHKDTGDGNHFHCLVWPLTTSEHTNMFANKSLR